MNNQELSNPEIPVDEDELRAADKAELNAQYGRTYSDTDSRSRSRRREPADRGIRADEVEVLRALRFDGGIIKTDLRIRGITIYGCSLIPGTRDYDQFISWPSHYSDRADRFFNYVYTEWASEDDHWDVMANIKDVAEDYRPSGERADERRGSGRRRERGSGGGRGRSNGRR